MSNLEKYTNLHKYAQRLAEDDLTEAQGPQATVAFTVGRVLTAVGHGVEAAAERVHNATPEQAERFYAAVGSVATQAQLLTAILGEVLAPMRDLTDASPDWQSTEKLSDVAATFEDGFHNRVLEEANQFLTEKEVAQ